MIDWPDEFPAPLIGTMYSPADPQLRTTLQSGRSFARRNFTAVPVFFPARFIFRKDVLAEAFELFYREFLKDGTEWFNMPLLLPQGRGNRIVRFVGIYAGPKRTNNPHATNGMWEYSANMEMYLRPGDTAPPDHTVYRILEDGSRRLLE